MGPGAVRPFCLLLMHELDAETEQVILEALKAPAREKPEVMTDFLSASDPVYRSRMMGLLTVCIGTGPLGILHVGAMAEWLGPSRAITVMAAEGLVVLLLAVVRWPALRRTGVSEDPA